MANYNDWDRSRTSSRQDWNDDDYRYQQNRRRFGQDGGNDPDYDGDRYRDEELRRSRSFDRDRNFGGESNRYRDRDDFNRSSGRDYDRYGTGGEYNRGGFGYGSSRDYDRRYRDRDYDNDNDRNWWDKTKDEVSSWFGDEDAERRRRRDERQGPHRGKGPRGYTRSDDRIKEDINDRLNDNDMVDATEIEVSVNEGDVVLSGTVNSRQEKRRAEDIAEDVSGVKNVENRVRVNQDTERNLGGTMGGTTGNFGSNSGSTTGNTYNKGTRV